MQDYRYAICIENSRDKNYFSEKIADAWLSWTKPVYYGCPNLAELVPKKSFIGIDIESP
jgi:Glycosyltransferase family 10 (fucosyltransferase) C-term